MIVIGMVVVLAIFVFVGWAVSAEMFQQRAWRRRASEGDPDIIGALINDSLGRWSRARPPKDLPANQWASVQQAEVIAVTGDGATLSTSLVLEYRTEDGRRLPVSPPLAEAIAVAARVLDMVLFDVPNLRLGSVRVDVYADFAAEGGGTMQRPVLTSTASRAVADGIFAEDLTPEEVLRRFDTLYHPTEGFDIQPIQLPPVEGRSPLPADEAARQAPWSESQKDHSADG